MMVALTLHGLSLCMSPYSAPAVEEMLALVTEMVPLCLVVFNASGTQRYPKSW